MNKKKIFSNLFSFFLAITLLIFILKWIFKDLNTSDLLLNLASISLINVSLLALSAIFNIWLFQYPYLVTTSKLTYFQAFQIRNTSFAISNCLPAGGTLGLAVQYSMFKSFQISNQAISTTIAISSVWNGLISFLMPLIGLICLVFVGDPGINLIKSAFLGALAIILSISLIYFVFKSKDTATFVGNLLNKLINPILKIFKAKKIDLAKSLVNFRDTTKFMVRKKWFSITITNFLVQLSMFLIFWVSCEALSLNLSPLLLFAIFCFGRFGTNIPFTPGGVGTTDVIMISMLTLYGANNATAVVAVFLWRIFYYIPQVLIGLGSFIYWQLSRSTSRL